MPMMAGSSAAMADMMQSLNDMKELSQQLTEVRDALPAAFQEAGDNYAAAVKDMAPEIEDVYQSTVNTGYRNIYFFLAAANLIGLLLLALYKEPKQSKKEV